VRAERLFVSEEEWLAARLGGALKVAGRAQDLTVGA